jgi:hypothetical protein
MTEPSSPSTKRSNRKRLWLFFFLVLPLILIAATVLLERQAGTDRLTKAIAEADRLDPGWRLDDIDASRKPMPSAGKNGIDQVLAVKAARIGGQDVSWSFPAYEKNAEELGEARKAMDESLGGDRKTPRLLNDEQVRVLRAERQRNEKAFILARALVDFDYGRFPLVIARDWYSTNFAHAQDARAAASLLGYDALLRAHDGDMVGALQDFRDILHAARAVGDEPFFLSQLVRISLASVAVNSLERSLGLGQASEQDLVVVQRYLTEESQTPYYLYGIRGERAGMDRYLEFVQKGKVDFSAFRQWVGMIGMAPSDSLTSLILYEMYLTIKSQRADLLECMNQVVEIGKLPPDKQSAAFTAGNLKMRELSRFGLARLLMPACGKIALADVRTKAILRVAITGVAAERFRMAKGRWPKELAELVPTYMESVPPDPFDGQPLRLKISDGAFVVYSVGIDSVDNGGQLDVKPFQPGSDIGFRLFDVDKRRQPALPFVFPPEDQAPDT